ncbi:hypothetical protein PSPO01_04716 [Paraphaeosphaeria sporulosa]
MARTVLRMPTVRRVQESRLTIQHLSSATAAPQRDGEEAQPTAGQEKSRRQAGERGEGGWRAVGSTLHFEIKRNACVAGEGTELTRSSGLPVTSLLSGVRGGVDSPGSLQNTCGRMIRLSAWQYHASFAELSPCFYDLVLNGELVNTAVWDRPSPIYQIPSLRKGNVPCMAVSPTPTPAARSRPVPGAARNNLSAFLPLTSPMSLGNELSIIPLQSCAIMSKAPVLSGSPYKDSKA